MADASVRCDHAGYLKNLFVRLTPQEKERLREICPDVIRDRWVSQKLKKLKNYSDDLYFQSGRVAYVAGIIGLKSREGLSIYDITELFAAGLLHQAGELDGCHYQTAKKIIEAYKGSWIKPEGTIAVMSGMLGTAISYDSLAESSGGDPSETIEKAKRELGKNNVPYIDLLR